MALLRRLLLALVALLACPCPGTAEPRRAVAAAGRWVQFEAGQLGEAGTPAAASPPLAISTSAVANRLTLLHFPSILVPRGAQVLSATIQFVGAAATTAGATASIRLLQGELPEVPPDDSSSLTFSAAAVGWAFGPWAAEDAQSLAHRTADFAPLCSSAFQAEAWRAGNGLTVALTFGALVQGPHSVLVRSGRQPVLRLHYDSPLSVAILDRGVTASQAPPNPVAVAANGAATLARNSSHLLQFTLAPLHPGASVTGAHIRFSPSASNSQAVQTVIAMEANFPFRSVSENGDISGRALGLTTVAWSPAPWTARGSSQLTAHQTPDLSALVNDLIAQPSWIVGGKLSFVITVSANGVGSRAFSAGSSAISNPELVLTITPAPGLEVATAKDGVVQATLAGGAFISSVVSVVGDGEPAAVFFEHVAIPAKSRVDSAFVQFSAASAEPSDIQAQIRSQTDALPGRIDTLSSSSVARTVSTAFSAWRPEAWFADEFHQSSALATVVQPILDGGFAFNNPMLFFIQRAPTDPSSGTRETKATGPLRPALLVSYRPGDISSAVVQASKIATESLASMASAVAVNQNPVLVNQNSAVVAFEFPYLDVPKGRSGTDPGVVLDGTHLTIPSRLGIGILIVDVHVVLGPSPTLTTLAGSLSSLPRLSASCVQWSWPALGTFDFVTQQVRSIDLSCALQQRINEPAYSVGDPVVVVLVTQVAASSTTVSRPFAETSLTTSWRAEINSCLVDNGGCGAGHQCLQTGDNQNSCLCSAGFELLSGTCSPSCLSTEFRTGPADCTACTVCRAGTFERSPCTATEDATCDECVLGLSFQDQPAQSTCLAVSSACETAEVGAPTTSSDRVCDAASGSSGAIDNMVLTLIVALGSGVLVIVFCCYCCWCRNRNKDQENARGVYLSEIVDRRQSAASGSAAAFFRNEVIAQPNDQGTAIFRSFRRSLRGSFRRPAWATRKSQQKSDKSNGSIRSIGPEDLDALTPTAVDASWSIAHIEEVIGSSELELWPADKPIPKGLRPRPPSGAAGPAAAPAGPGAGPDHLYQTLTQKSLERGMQEMYQAISPPDYSMVKPFVLLEKYVEPPTEEDPLFDQLQRMEVPRANVQCFEVLHETETTVVHRGSMTSTASVVPTTVKSLSEEASQEDRVRLLQEAAVMMQFDHDNVLRMLGCVTNSEPILVLLESSDRTLLAALKAGKVATDRSLPIAIDVASGLEYLTSKEFVHRAITSENIALVKGRAKIANFMTTRQGSEYQAQTAGTVALRWAPPEAYNYGIYSEKSDVWSFGCLLHELYSGGSTPYKGMDTQAVVQQVENGYRMPPDPSCPRSVYEIQMSCWHPYPNQRPTVKNLHSHLELIKENVVSTMGLCGLAENPLQFTYTKKEFDIEALTLGSDVYSDPQDAASSKASSGGRVMHYELDGARLEAHSLPAEDPYALPQDAMPAPPPLATTAGVYDMGGDPTPPPRLVGEEGADDGGATSDEEQYDVPQTVFDEAASRDGSGPRPRFPRPASTDTAWSRESSATSTYSSVGPPTRAPQKRRDSALSTASLQVDFVKGMDGVSANPSPPVELQQYLHRRWAKLPKPTSIGESAIPQANAAPAEAEPPQITSTALPPLPPLPPLPAGAQHGADSGGGYETIDADGDYANVAGDAPGIGQQWSPTTHRRPLPTLPLNTKPASQEPWFHQQLSDNEIQRVLVGSADGTFLVSRPHRDATTAQLHPNWQVYRLSYAASGRVVTHHLAMGEDGKWSIAGQPVGAPRYADLDAVIGFLVARRPTHSALETTLSRGAMTAVTEL